MARTRIVWTDAEKFQLAKRAFELRSSNTQMSDIQCLRQAQEEMLNPERRRKLLTLSVHAPFLLPMWKEFTAEAAAREAITASEGLIEKAVKTAEEPYKHQHQVTASVSYAPARIQPLVPPSVERDYGQQQKGPSVADLSTEALAMELVKRMMALTDGQALRQTIREVVNEVLEERVPSMLLVNTPSKDKPPRHDPLPPETNARVRLPKVLILGLMTKQEQLLVQEYRGIDFYFLSGEEGFKRIENTHRDMDFTIKTNWVKCKMGSTAGWKNFAHANGLDGIRVHLKQKFNMEPLR